jgi:hypothetical protein
MHQRLGLEGADLPWGIQTVKQAHPAFSAHPYRPLSIAKMGELP